MKVRIKTKLGGTPCPVFAAYFLARFRSTMRCSEFMHLFLAFTLATSGVVDGSAEAGHVSLLQTRAVLRENIAHGSLDASSPMPMGSVSRFASSDLEHVQIHPHLSYHEARGLFGGHRKGFGKPQYHALFSEEHQIQSEDEWQDAVQKIAVDAVAKDAAERDSLSEEAKRSADLEVTKMQDEEAIAT